MKKKSRVHDTKDTQNCECRSTMDVTFSMNSLKRKIYDVQHILNDIHKKLDERIGKSGYDSGSTTTPLRSRHLFPKVTPLYSFKREPHSINGGLKVYPSERNAPYKTPKRMNTPQMKLFTHFQKNTHESTFPHSALLQRSIALRKSRAGIYSGSTKSGEIIMDRYRNTKPLTCVNYDEYESSATPSLYSARYYSRMQSIDQRVRENRDCYMNPYKSVTRPYSDEDAGSRTSVSSEETIQHQSRAECEEVTSETLLNDLIQSITSFIQECITQIPPEVILRLDCIQKKWKDKKTIETINMDDIRSCARALGNTNIKSYSILSRCLLYSINALESKIKESCYVSGDAKHTTITLKDIDGVVQKIALDCMKQIPPGICKTFGLSTERIEKTIGLFSCANTSKFWKEITDQLQEVKKAIELFSCRDSNKFQSGMTQLKNTSKDRSMLSESDLLIDDVSLPKSESSSSHILSGVRLTNIRSHKNDESDSSTNPISTQYVSELETHSSNDEFGVPYVESVSDSSSLHSYSE